MILPKHPDLMSNEDLGEWIHRLVSLKTPESIFLDYKETISTDSRSDKREIAKDVSSFANERGGVVLYGIPEDRSGDEPVPVDVGDIGMDPVAGLLQVVEDILVNTLTPRLPELRVREVPLPHLPDKVVYLVWHPESWEAPHMIHAYGQHRYYRRGNSQSVPMEEGEVERLYVKRQARRELAPRFLEEADFDEASFPRDGRLLRIVCCPSFPFSDRVDFAQEAMRDWLEHNSLDNTLGWLPFISGVYSEVVRTRPDVYQAHVRLFDNGAVSFCAPNVGEVGLSGLRFLKHLDFFLRLVERFYGQIHVVGDVLIDVAFLNVNEIEFVAQVSLTWDGHPLRWDKDTLTFQVTASAMGLLTSEGRWALERRIMDRLVRCFGLWTIPMYFLANGSPVTQPTE